MDLSGLRDEAEDHIPCSGRISRAQDGEPVCFQGSRRARDPRVTRCRAVSPRELLIDVDCQFRHHAGPVPFQSPALLAGLLCLQLQVP